MTTLRPYQTRVILLARESYRQGNRRVLLVMPTGSGKTKTACEIVRSAHEKHRKVLWLAHRRELVEQASYHLPIPHGYILAGKPTNDEPVQVASVQTITAREAHPEADFIVIDEAHHAVADTLKAIVDAYPKAWILGLTATPERSDGTPLGDVFDSMVTGPSIADLQRLGHLVKADVIAPDSLGTKLAKDPVIAWQQWSENRPGFVFASTLSQSANIARALTDAGYPAMHISGQTSLRVRAQAIADFKSSHLQVLSSVFVFTEGFDAPRAEICMFARGCGHASTYLQCAGRVLRPHPGKTSARIIDLRGIVHEHGLIEAPRRYSLSGKAIEQTEPPKIRTCGECWRVLTGPGPCPNCGTITMHQEIGNRSLSSVSASIKKAKRAPLMPHASEAIKTLKLEGWIEEAKTRGYKKGWVFWRFKSTFGHAPPGF